jgi:ankyrin repeat protein
MDASWEEAASRGDAQTARTLLTQGMGVDSRDSYGQTALMLAAHAGHRKVVELLIAHRANLNVTAKFGLSALMLAIVAGHTEIAILLAQAGADLALRGSGTPGFAGKTAYDLAAERGMQDLTKILMPEPGQSRP